MTNFEVTFTASHSLVNLLAASIDYYSYLWLSDPVVHGLIENSGLTSLIAPRNKTASSSTWLNLASVIGCGGAGSNQCSLSAYMRDASITNVIEAVETHERTPSVVGSTVFIWQLYRPTPGW